MNRNELIDERLDALRPDRYQPGEGADWLAPIIEEVASTYTADEARIRIAADVVMQRETVAMKRTNRVLRDMLKSGQFPIDWMDIHRWPLGCGEWRVALGSCRTVDLREFATVERRRAAKDFATRNESCEGAEWLADLVADKGLLVVDDLEQELRGDAAVKREVAS